MKEQIRKEVMKVYDQEASVDEVVDKLLVLFSVAEQSEQYCDDNEITYNRYRLHYGFANCPDCGEEL